MNNASKYDNFCLMSSCRGEPKEMRLNVDSEWRVMARGNCFAVRLSQTSSVCSVTPRCSRRRDHQNFNNEIWLQLNWKRRTRRQWTLDVKMSEEQEQCDSFNSWELNGLNSLDLWDYTVELECLQGTEGLCCKVSCEAPLSTLAP